ncbi:MAG: DUF421 domain-containing protein [Acidimicrobiales bacterium]
MLKDVFDYPSLHTATVIAGKTAVVYVVLIAGLRLLGKRELGQMSLADLVLIVILGNAVQNAMIDNDNTLGGGVVAAFVLLVINRLLNAVMVRSPRAERALIGEPSLLVSDGKIIEGHMTAQGVTHDQLYAGLREHGFDGLDGVHLVVLEVDGTMSVVPSTAEVLRTRRHYRGLRLP